MIGPYGKDLERMIYLYVDPSIAGESLDQWVLMHLMCSSESGIGRKGRELCGTYSMIEPR